MGYQSFGFLLFTALVLAIYYGPLRRHQRVALGLANLAFYAIAGLRYIPFLLVTMAASFLSARRIGAIYAEADEKLASADAAQKKQLRADAKAKAKKALLAGILVTIALLVVCKYTGFITENLNSLLAALGVGQIPTFRMILPVGISFYSFMALSYVLDVYWKRYKAEQSFLAYAVYLSYFPHVVQGPIDRFNEFKAQTEAPVAFDYDGFMRGAQLMLWGFFKKLVVADHIGMFVDGVLDHWAQHRGFILAITFLVYSVQIYADFSGCIDIVTGVSEMFGIRLRKNFDHPYFSRSMAEFWRRWHISLQEWFKDYIYFPVSASDLVRSAKKRLKAKGKTRAADLFAACFPVLVVWLITGIWHGAAWNYVVWGLFHAFWLISGKILEQRFARVNEKLRIKTESRLWHFWQMLRTYLICSLGRVFFRADDLGMAGGILKKLLRPEFSLRALLHPAVDYGTSGENMLIAAAGIVVLLIADILQERMPLRDRLAKRSTALRWIILYAGIFAVIVLGVYGPGANSSFIYQQF